MSGDLRFADADVAVDGQCDGEPDGRRVEDCRQAVGQRHVGGTPAVRHPVTIGAQRVEVDEARQRTEPGEHVGQRHGGQDEVGGGAHAATQQHHADQRVGEQCQQNHRRRDVAVERHRYPRPFGGERHH